MEAFKAIVLGIVQGITEPLPVSSAAFLILFRWFFGWEGEIDSLTFDVAIHGGTLLALILYFYRDWIDLFMNDRRLLLFIAIATIPAGTAGLLLYDIVEHMLRDPLIIAFSLSSFGILMLFAEKYGRQTKESLHTITLKDAIFIGTAQAIALIPGVSRSGITITAGLFRNLKRESAARFSFLLATPVIGGATLLEGKHLLIDQNAYSLDIFAIGFISAFISGFLAIKFLLGFLKHYPLHVFVYFRLILASIILFKYYL
jgi:undecaprenyl-diphosphatase